MPDGADTRLNSACWLPASGNAADSAGRLSVSSGGNGRAGRGRQHTGHHRRVAALGHSDDYAEPANGLLDVA